MVQPLLLYYLKQLDRNGCAAERDLCFIDKNGLPHSAEMVAHLKKTCVLLIKRVCKC